MKLHQSLKRMERTIKLTNEVKMGVWHLVSLIDANKGLLQALPKHPTPVLDLPYDTMGKPISKYRKASICDVVENHNENRVVAGLSWCEERLLAINEVKDTV